MLEARWPLPRDPRQPEDAADDEAQRAELKRTAADAVRAALAGFAQGDTPPPGCAAIADEAPVRRRRFDGSEYATTRGAELRDWLCRQAVALDGCQDVRAFREAQCGGYEIRPMSCHSRICASCERQRSARVVRLVDAYIEQHVEERWRSYSVLTVRNTAELDRGLDLIIDSISRLWRRPLMRGGRCRWRTRDGKPGHPCSSRRAGHVAHRPNRNCPNFRHRPAPGRERMIEAAMRFIEVTFNDDARTWHPHVNVLMDAQFIIQAELSDTWRALTCPDRAHRRAGWCPEECDGGSPVVWIERVGPGTVREAIKYVTKAADLVRGDDPWTVVEFLIATRGRRLMQGYGAMAGYEVVEEEIPETETVVLKLDMGVHDREGRPLFARFTLPRYCRHCGRDTAMPDGSCTYEPPIIVPRTAVRLVHGVATWQPPPEHRPDA